MASLRQVFEALDQMREDGVIGDFALGGGMAALFYAETTRTYDLDVFAYLPSQRGALLDLHPIYEWAEAHGFAPHAEHLLIHGVPVQLLAANGGLAAEAVAEARTLDYEGHGVRVVAPEFLITLYLIAGGGRRVERVEALIAAGAVNIRRLRALMGKYALASMWQTRWEADDHA
ncbi:MAG TPA: hypothetical protein VGN26_20250 [Armatimonadota bacterium]|jgi:hypothetical protein